MFLSSVLTVTSLLVRSQIRAWKLSLGSCSRCHVAEDVLTKQRSVLPARSGRMILFWTSAFSVSTRTDFFALARANAFIILVWRSAAGDLFCGLLRSSLVPTPPPLPDVDGLIGEPKLSNIEESGRAIVSSASRPPIPGAAGAVLMFRSPGLVSAAADPGTLGSSGTDELCKRVTS